MRRISICIQQYKEYSSSLPPANGRYFDRYSVADSRYPSSGKYCMHVLTLVSCINKFVHLTTRTKLHINVQTKARFSRLNCWLSLVLFWLLNSLIRQVGMKTLRCDRVEGSLVYSKVPEANAYIC
jgi:hypothetical protein